MIRLSAIRLTDEGMRFAFRRIELNFAALETS